MCVIVLVSQPSIVSMQRTDVNGIGHYEAWII